MKKLIKGIEDNHILTSQQKIFLKEFAKSDLSRVFRLTGGTALSAFYLQHRLSVDIDLFSSEKIPFYIVEDFLKPLDFIETISLSRLFDRNIFNLIFKDGTILKTEFTYYPLKNLEDVNVIDGIQIDSFLDIVVNKLCAIADRLDAKDYVDVYCALRNSDLTLEYLINLAQMKCEIKGISYILQSRLLQVPDGVDKLPMNIILTRGDIEGFFKNIVREIVEKERQ